MKKLREIMLGPVCLALLLAMIAFTFTIYTHRPAPPAPRDTLMILICPPVNEGGECRMLELDARKTADRPEVKDGHYWIQQWTAHWEADSSVRVPGTAKIVPINGPWGMRRFTPLMLAKGDTIDVTYTRSYDGSPYTDEPGNLKDSSHPVDCATVVKEQ